VLINLTTEKTYEQRADQYCSTELIWWSVEASPDGQTLLASGFVWGGFPDEYRFYDFSRPDQGFRLLPLELCLVIPEEDHPFPEWHLDEGNNNTVTLVAELESQNDSIFRFVLRREGDRMVELHRTPVKKKE